MSRRKIKRKRVRDNTERWKCSHCTKTSVQLRYVRPSSEDYDPDHNIAFVCTFCNHVWPANDPDRIEALLGARAASAVRRVKQLQGVV